MSATISSVIHSPALAPLKAPVALPEEMPVVSKKTRCGQCQKKLGLMGFDCKCGGKFCGQHRLEFDHGCTYDHAAAEKQRLEANLVKVVKSKVDII